VPELDPQIKQLLDGMRAAGNSPLYEMAVDDARAAILAISGTLDIALEQVAEVSDVLLEDTFSVRCYSPSKRSQPRPVILHMHGGGFALGDLDSHDRICRHYCNALDALVVSVDYRRPPEHSFPCAVEDSYRALTWIGDQAEERNIDVNRIVLTGDSAGGNLAASVSQLALDRGGPAVCFQVLVYPALNLSIDADYPSRVEFGGGEYFLGQKDIQWIRSMYFDDLKQGNDQRASPLLNEDLKRLPPTLIITAGFDPLRDEGELYYQRLREAGVNASYRCFDDAIHGFVSFAGVADIGKDAIALIIEKTKQFIKGIE